MAGIELLPSIESQIVIIIAIIIIAILLVKYYRKTVALGSRLEQEQEAFRKRLEQKQTQAFRAGQMIKGEIYQILGTFGLLNEYRELIFLSTTSQQASLDLLGIKEDSLDFIELKAKSAEKSRGADLTTEERKLKKLVTEKKVNWITKDVELPEGFKITER